MMWRSFRRCRIAIALVSIVLAGCQRLPDSAQARICRSIAPAVEGAGARIEVLSTSSLARANGVEVTYRTEQGAGRRRVLVCQFATDRFRPGGEPVLAAVSVDGRAMGEVRLAFLQRFWLDTPEGSGADPAPYLLLAEIPDLPPWAALALQHLLSTLPIIGIYAVLAPSYALIYGLVGRINLAFGEFAAVAAYGALLGGTVGGGPAAVAATLLLAFAFGLWASAIHGLAASMLVFTRLTRSTGQQTLIATIGLALALQEYMRLAQGSAFRWLSPVLNQPVGVARSQSFVVTVTPMAGLVTALAVAAALGLLLLMQRSHFGRLWRACADDRSAAMLVGVDPAAVLARTFVLACLLAGLAGTIVTVLYGGLGFAGGIVLGLKSLIAAVAGGIGSVPGAFLGGILIGGTEALWSALFPIEYRDVAIYTLLAALLIWRPGGLLGSGDPPPVPRR